jgi:hypothetical protein
MPNLRVQHAAVGPFRGQTVVSEDVFEGGRAEVDRLVGLGALAWTEDAVTEAFPAARSAVAEMPDDELTKENERLRAELEKAKAEAEKVAADAAVKAKADADAELAAVKAELESLKAEKGKAKK